MTVLSAFMLAQFLIGTICHHHAIYRLSRINIGHFLMHDPLFLPPPRPLQLLPRPPIAATIVITHHYS
jgi:hypothetical protein